MSEGSNYHGPFSLIEIQIDVYLTREHTENKVEHIQSTMEEITENFQAGKYWQCPCKMWHLADTVTKKHFQLVGMNAYWKIQSKWNHKPKGIEERDFIFREQ